MKFEFIKSGAAAVIISAATLFGGAVDAAPINYEGKYKASSVVTSGNLHTVWLPKLFDGISGTAAYWQFKPKDGKFVVGADNSTADLTGRIVNNVESSWMFDLDVSYELRDPNVPGDETKDGGGTYAGSGDSWSFFDIAVATMTGVGELAGLMLTMEAHPDPAVKDIPFQLGDGANDKNPGLGGAGWFKWTATTTAGYTGPSVNSSLDFGSGHHGDININLEPVPVPAAGLLLLAGIGGLGVMRARKKKS